ncbi:DUF2075 domain-containing protein [Propioniciclava soli]|uniref:DUF2075 domain-containing protein n=1 Tax=Propioniciclava soli TaxID=2775081 RepID=A0ABZ3C6Q8_9ACTN
MTSFEIRRYGFDRDELRTLHDIEAMRNWPVVYVLDRPAEQPARGSVYFGESVNFLKRMADHLASEEKRQLTTVRVVLDETFNKSACLDLESHLIRYAAGDGSLEVLNRVDGVVDANYFDRRRYREVFDEVFEELREEGLFQRTIPEIINSELFKLSPFKALNTDQAVAVDDIMEGLAADLGGDDDSTSVSFVQGAPGTGKTVIAIYLMKLIADIGQHRGGDGVDRDTLFSDFFVEGYRERFQGLKIGLVVPQQALRMSIRRVFDKTPGLSRSMVVTAFDVADSADQFDVLIVDEAHRLTQFAAQSHGSLTKRFRDVNSRLFAGLQPQASQLDWLRVKTKHLILMLDQDQSVRPADLSQEQIGVAFQEATRLGRSQYRLRTQMRSEAGEDYIDYVQAVLSRVPPAERLDFRPYEVGIVDSPADLVATIREKDSEHGLSRVVAGYAWQWVSAKDPTRYDIELGETKLRWNTRSVDLVNSPTALDESGSIHTVQGYDLNYAGVIIGPDLRYDLETEELFIDRRNYFDKAGKRNNTMAGQVTTDEMLFRYITNVYFVLMTRGIRGTFLHVVDPGLRKYLGRYFGVL